MRPPAGTGDRRAVDEAALSMPTAPDGTFPYRRRRTERAVGSSLAPLSGRSGEGAVAALDRAGFAVHDGGERHLAAGPVPDVAVVRAPSEAVAERRRGALPSAGAPRGR